MYLSVSRPPHPSLAATPTARGLVRSIALGPLIAALLAAVPAAAAERPQPGPEIRRTVEALRQSPLRVDRTDRLDDLGTKNHQCVAQFISCGETVTTDITDHDCATTGTDPTFFDVFFFDGVAGQTITATMTSTAFDPFLFLFFPDVEKEPITDDNGGGGLDARIVYTLDETSSEWSLTPTPLDAFVTGPYTLTLECSGGGDPPPPPPPPPADGFFTDPEYPDFRFRVEITPPNGTPIDGTHLTDCQEDTVCVAGAVPDRPELYIRILGPRPNGYLWPTLVRFTPSAVTVEIEQISSGDTQTYVLDGVGPGDDNLSGLQDRTGFLP